MSAASGLEHLKPFLPGLESALEDSEVSEIMINGPGNVWVERAGRLTAHDAPDLDESALLRAAIHIARPLGWTRRARRLSMRAWTTDRGLPSVFRPRAPRWRSPCGALASGRSRRMIS